TCFKTLTDKITEIELEKSYQTAPTFGERARLLMNNILPSSNGSHDTPVTNASPNAGPSRPSGASGRFVSPPTTAPSHEYQHQRTNLGQMQSNAALLRADFARMRFGSTDAEIDAQHGYSFSQEE